MSAPPLVKALNCPNCGAAVTLRAGQHTLTVVCESCLCVLDAKDPNLQVLQQMEEALRAKPTIPLGTRGRLPEGLFEVIGFQVRFLTVDGSAYFWSEYLLFNPYKGFRYLTEYQGHWSNVAPLRMLPAVTLDARTATVLGKKFKAFQHAQATTSFVLGEFPWRVAAGDQATVRDYVAPPWILSQEFTKFETTWSAGAYLTGAEVWKAFSLPGKAPRPVGVYANQPSPYQGRLKSLWALCLLSLVLLFALAQGFLAFTAQEEVFRRRYSFSPRTLGEASFVTGVFELKGRPSSVEVSTLTDLSNQWAYFRFALINVSTGEAFDFGREVSYYSGADSDGAWSEGGRSDAARVPSVPAGRYYLRVEPEMDASASPMDYELVVRRDVPQMGYFWLAGLLLLIPPIFSSFRARAFEGRRWMESDFNPAASSSGDSGDDD